MIDLMELLDTLGPLLIPRMRVAMPHPGAGPDKNLQQSFDEHSEIVAAIGKPCRDRTKPVQGTPCGRTCFG